MQIPVRVMHSSILSLLAAVQLPVIGLQPDVPNYGAITTSAQLYDVEIGNAWGKLFTSSYQPPATEFDHVVLELDFATFGRQFDRLGHLYYNGIEVWRFSTPEPSGSHINTTMVKDVSHYIELFKQPGTLELQVDNVVDSTYTGTFSVQISALYYKSDNTAKTSEQWWYNEAPDSYTALQVAPLVSIPPALSLPLPQQTSNTTRLGVQVFTSGNSDEEFWYTNLVNQTGPTRQIQLKIDGMIAAIIDPFQPEYTGTDNPYWWSTLVGPNAYDVPSYYIDITSFLPQLWDAAATIELSVVNGFNSDTVLASWLTNVALLGWQTQGFEGIGGDQVAYETIEAPKVDQYAVGDSEVDYVSITNYLFRSCTLFDSSGKTIYTEWEQSETSRNLEVQTEHSAVSLAFSKGTTKLKYNGSLFDFTFEYPKAVYFTDDKPPGQQFGIGGCVYSYIVQTGDYSLNNTINTSIGVKGNTTSTDGYLGVSAPVNVLKHVKVSGRNYTLETSAWSGLGSSWWDDVFDQFDSARSSPQVLKSLALEFNQQLFS